MVSVKITDNSDLDADVALQDIAPLAKVGLKELVTAVRQFFDTLDGPIDKVEVKTIKLGGTFTSPNLLGNSAPLLTVALGMNAALTVATSDQKLLFADDGFAPKMPIGANEAWLGFEVDLNLSLSGTAPIGMFGLSCGASSKLSCCTWTRFSGTPLPRVLPSIEGSLNNYSFMISAASLRAQKDDTVHTAELSGSIMVAVALQQPVTLNPLASVGLPFNQTVSLQPAVTLALGVSIEICGDFVLRAIKPSQEILQIGLYKKHGSTFTATLAASGGVEGEIDRSDVLDALLKAALPGVDLKEAGITGDNATELNNVVKEGLSRSLSAQLNATCSASLADEVAVLYQIDLAKGDPAVTEEALNVALHGDWTKLEALTNATCLRNIAVETVEKKTSLTLNLFGFYSSTSITDYLKSCTVLVDDSGQLSMTDKVEANAIRASVSPTVADPDKLRRALMDGFVCTAAYAAAGHHLKLCLSAMQSYLDYKQTMGQEEMRQNLCLLYALGAAKPRSLDNILAETPSKHSCVSANVKYDSSALMRVFFKDADMGTYWLPEEVEKAGRDAMCVFLNPADPTDVLRKEVLENDALWKAMDGQGNAATFGSIPGLNGLGTTELAAVCSDWISIAWWRSAVLTVAPAINAVQYALDKAPAEASNIDPAVTKARQNLSNALGKVVRQNDAAFTHGWDVAVIFGMSGKSGLVNATLTYNSKSVPLP